MVRYWHEMFFLLFHVLYKLIVQIFGKFQLRNIQTDKSNAQLPSAIIIVKNQTWTQQRFVPSSYEKMSFKPLVLSFAMMLLIQPMVGLIKSQNKNKVKCNAVVFTSTFLFFSIKRLFIWFWSNYSEVRSLVVCQTMNFSFFIINDMRRI